MSPLLYQLSYSTEIQGAHCFEMPNPTGIGKLGVQGWTRTSSVPNLLCHRRT